MDSPNVDEIRKKCNRLERIVLDTLQTWQWNRKYILKQIGSEPFDIDELLEIISQYGPWTSPERELPLLALYHILGYFEREGLVHKIGDDAWEICIGG